MSIKARRLARDGLSASLANPVFLFLCSLKAFKNEPNETKRLRNGAKRAPWRAQGLPRGVYGRPFWHFGRPSGGNLGFQKPLRPFGLLRPVSYRLLSRFGDPSSLEKYAPAHTGAKIFQKPYLQADFIFQIIRKIAVHFPIILLFFITISM